MFADAWQNILTLGIAIIILLLIFAFFVYFFPSFLASIRRKRQVDTIFVLNLFLGWSILGWVAALMWAVLKEDSDGA
jgi:hypothetical protein